MPIDDSELSGLAGVRLYTPVSPVCPQCNYNLTGLIEARCPECGYRFDWGAVRRRARTQWLEALGLKTMPEEIDFGFRITWIAWGVALFVNSSVALMRVFNVLSFTLYTLFIVLMLAQLLMAFCGVFLCAHIIKFNRLSEEVRQELRIDVPVAKAWIGLLASSVLLLISLPMCLRVALA